MTFWATLLLVIMYRVKNEELHVFVNAETFILVEIPTLDVWKRDGAAPTLIANANSYLCLVHG